VVAHDLAALELREGYPAERVLAALDEAEALLAADGNGTLLATAAITRAGALGAAGATAAAVEAGVMAALERAETVGSAIIRAKVAIDGAAVLGRMRPLAVAERERLEAAVRVVIAGGYAGQARKVLARPALLALARDAEAELRRLAGEGA
jgi:hypothetical protein